MTTFRQNAKVQIKNSASLMYPLAQSLAAGVVPQNTFLRGKLIGDYLNDTGADQTLKIEAQLGSQVLISKTSEAIPPSPVRAPVVLDFLLAVLGNSTQQFFEISFRMGRQDAAGVGIGMIPFGYTIATEFATAGPSSVDMAATQVFRIGVQHSVADENLDFTKYAWLLEVI